MPIQTGGFQVQALPQYTAMDPNRVTFNPAGFTEGALSSIGLMNELSKRKAYLQQQEDLAAVREGRLGAENATNLATINVAPQRSLADIAIAQKVAALSPMQTNVGLAQGEGELANLGLAKELRPLTDETAITQAMAANAASIPNAEVALAEAENRKRTQPVVNELAFRKAQQDLASITEDKNLSDAQKIASIRNTLASAAQSEAQARKEDRIPADADPLTALSKLQLEIQRLEASPVINPNADNRGTPMPVIQYDAQTRGPDGKLLTMDAPGWFTGDIPMAVNPEAERIREQLTILKDRRDALTRQLSAPPKSSSGAPAATAIGAGPSSPQDLIAAVKSGQISKEQAKQYATSKGWK